MCFLSVLEPQQWFQQQVFNTLGNWSDNKVTKIPYIKLRHLNQTKCWLCQILAFGQLFEALQVRSEGGTQNTIYHRALEACRSYKPTNQPTNQPMKLPGMQASSHLVAVYRDVSFFQWDEIGAERNSVWAESGRMWTVGSHPNNRQLLASNVWTRKWEVWAPTAKSHPLGSGTVATSFSYHS